MVDKGAIQPDTLKTLDRPLMDITPETFVNLANTNIEKAGKLIRERTS